MATRFVTRLDAASLPSVGSFATFASSSVALGCNDGSHPCSPYPHRPPSGIPGIDNMTHHPSGSGVETFVAVVRHGRSPLTTAVLSSARRWSRLPGRHHTTTPWATRRPSGGAIQPSPWYPAAIRTPSRRDRLPLRSMSPRRRKHFYKQASCSGGTVRQ